MVLVVSEERKEISLSYQGQLVRGANQNIRSTLVDVMEGRVPDTLKQPADEDGSLESGSLDEESSEQTNESVSRMKPSPQPIGNGGS